jgi:hypothetical protein
VHAQQPCSSGLANLLLERRPLSVCTLQLQSRRGEFAPQLHFAAARGVALQLEAVALHLGLLLCSALLIQGLCRVSCLRIAAETVGSMDLLRKSTWHQQVTRWLRNAQYTSTCGKP